jgi:hypothetical protein
MALQFCSQQMSSRDSTQIKNGGYINTATGTTGYGKKPVCCERLSYLYFQNAFFAKLMVVETMYNFRYKQVFPTHTAALLS